MNQTLTQERDILTELFGLDWNQFSAEYAGLTVSEIEACLNEDTPELTDIEPALDYRGRPIENNAEMAERVYRAVNS